LSRLGDISATTAIMKPIFTAVLFGLAFAFLGYVAVDAQIPPLSLLDKYAPIVLGIIGVAVGFWFGTR
jgi:hypothetical protein